MQPVVLFVWVYFFVSEFILGACSSAFDLWCAVLKTMLFHVSFPLECGGELTATYGSISSPGYPGNYPVNRDCFWTISTNPGLLITFAFGTLSLEHHENCSYDYLEVRFNCALWLHFFSKVTAKQDISKLFMWREVYCLILNLGSKYSFVLTTAINALRYCW